MTVLPAEVHIWWKKRKESLESLRLGTILKSPSIDQDDGIAGIQNVGNLPPIPFNTSDTIDLFYQSVSLSGKKRKVAWLESPLYTTINDVGGISDTDTTVTLTSVTGLSIDDVLKIEDEFVSITDINGNDVDIIRGEHGTVAVAHTDTTKVIKILCSVPWNYQVLDGRTDTLPAPASIDAAGGYEFIKVSWTLTNYTALERKLVKHFIVYRHDSGTFPGESAKIAEVDTTTFVDALSPDDTTLYYYWVRAIDTSGNAGTLSSSDSAKLSTDTDVPGTPTLVVIAEAQANGGMLITFGVEPPATNASGISSTTVQLATDSSFVDKVYDQIFGATPISGSWLSSVRKTYYGRTKVTNAYGDSSWSSTVTIDTADIFNVPDTGYPGVVQNLAVYTDDQDVNIPGLELVIEFDPPATNANGIYAYAVQVYTSATFPTHTFHKGPATGAVFKAGDYSLTHTGQDFSGLVGKILFVYRNGNTHNELCWSSKITAIVDSNQTVQTEQPHRYSSGDYSGNMYYAIVTPDWEQVTVARTLDVPILNNTFFAQPHYKTYVTGLAAGTYYARVCAGNAYGLGNWVTSGTGRSIDGLKSGDYKNSSVITTKINDLAVTGGKIAGSTVTYDKLSVSYLSAISADLGTVTAGTVTGATLRTAASGARVEINSSDGLKAINSSGIMTAQLSTANNLYLRYGLTGDNSNNLSIINGYCSLILHPGTGIINIESSISVLADINLGGTLYMDNNSIVSETRQFVGSGGVSVGSAGISGGAISGSSLNIGSGTVTCGVVTASSSISCYGLACYGEISASSHIYNTGCGLDNTGVLRLGSTTLTEAQLISLKALI